MNEKEPEARFPEVATLLSQVGRELHRRGWALGTSGNFSAVITRDPLRLAITSTGIDKGTLSADQIVQIDGSGETVKGSHRPSSEARLHLMVCELLGASAVLHTHSVWSTLLSELQASEGGISMEGYEMLKGLRGVKTHQHLEWLPIIENSQDVVTLSESVKAQLIQNPDCHGFLLRGHGLYTWGQSLGEAKRHVEILEFLLEVMGRMYWIKGRGSDTVFSGDRLALTER